MNDLPRDRIDDELHRRLGALAPSDDDTNSVLAALRPRMTSARRRRRVAIAAGSAMTAAALVGAIATLSGDPFSTKVDTLPPATRPDVAPTVPSVTANTTTTTGSRPVASTSTADTTADTTTSEPVTSTTGDTGTTGAPVSVTQTCSSTGGTVTVRWDGTTLVLQSAAPAGGYSVAGQDLDPDRVRVEFAPEDGTRYEVEARGAGAIVECDVNTKG